MQIAWMPVNKPRFADLTAVRLAPQEMSHQDYMAVLALRVQALVNRAKHPQAAADQLCEDLADVGVLPQWTSVKAKGVADLLLTAEELQDRLYLLDLLPTEPRLKAKRSLPVAELALQLDQTRKPEARLRTIALLLRA
jgi:hypothetical protein